MRIHDASETHPAPRKLFDDLDIGRKVKTQATIGFGNGRTEYAQFFEFFDQVEGVGVAMFEFVGDGNDFAVYEAPDFSDDHLPLSIKWCVHDYPGPSYVHDDQHAARGMI